MLSTSVRVPIVAAVLFGLFSNLLAIVPSLYTLQVYDRVLSSRSLDTLLMLSLLVLICLVALALLDAIRGRLLTLAGVRFEAASGGALLSEMLRQTARESRASAGSPLRDLRQVRQFLSSRSLSSLCDLPWSPIFLILITLFHPLLGAVALAGVLLLLALAWLDDRVSRRGYEEAIAAGRRAGDYAERAVANADAVVSMGMGAALQARWARLGAIADAHLLGASRRAGRIETISRFVRQAVQVTMLGLGAWLVIRQEASPGVMIAATIVLGRALSPIESVIVGWRGFVEARGAWRRLRQVVASLRAQPARMALPRPLGNVAAERVTFGPDAASPIIRGLSFTVSEGELVGLIGPSGAGKSTLGRLLVGLLAPRAGTVRIDGADIRTRDPDDVGRYVGYLPQDPMLIDGTVAENIARLRDPNTCAGAVIAAATEAGVHEMILSLPNGYDTPIGPSGVPLSGGERQRIGLARAIFDWPSLVVLDEPNANLDTAGELALSRLLLALKERRITTILITHRPALLGSADRVMVLQSGTIIVFGARQDVLGKVIKTGAPTLVRTGGGTR
ncbi:MAG: type I secretion system permease/ATPase [Lautropia sp.]